MSRSLGQTPLPRSETHRSDQRTLRPAATLSPRVRHNCVTIQLNWRSRSALRQGTRCAARRPARARAGTPERSRAPAEEIKDPYVLEFLDLKDEYSESDLEAALIAKIESFLLELGGDFTFVGRQRRLRVGDTWYRVDLMFFHRRLRCLVIIDLKLDRFTHADAGQMHLYLNYARERWTLEGENPPALRVSTATSRPYSCGKKWARAHREDGYAPDSRTALSCSRSLRFARRIAIAMTGATTLEKPLGSPRLRRVMRVLPSSTGAQV